MQWGKYAEETDTIREYTGIPANLVSFKPLNVWTDAKKQQPENFEILRKRLKDVQRPVKIQRILSNTLNPREYQSRKETARIVSETRIVWEMQRTNMKNKIFKNLMGVQEP